MATNNNGTSTFFCRHCGEKQKTKKELHRHIALSHVAPTTTPAPRTYVHRNESDAPIQQPGSAIKSNTTMLHCDVCERYFVNGGALQMHCENSKAHKDKANKQRMFIQPNEGINALVAGSSTVASTMLYGYQAYVGNTLPTRNYGIPANTLSHGEYSITELGRMETLTLNGQAGIVTSSSMQNSTSWSLTSQNNSILATPISKNLLAPNMVANERPSPSLTQITTDSNEASLQHRNNCWSVISASQQPAVLEALLKHRHSPEELLKQQYCLRPYEPDDIAGLCKCKNCGGQRKKLQTQVLTNCIFHRGKRQNTVNNQKDGRKAYSCCGELGRGCVSLPTHSYTAPDRRLAAKHQEFAPTPPYSSQRPKRRAVTIDCEMAGVQGAMSEVILVCAVDYLTGETLINALVRPNRKVIDWRTRFSGVTPGAMATATARGETLKGWKEARNEIWKHIDANTVLVGHALQHDLDVLRMIHTHIVDSALLTRIAVGPSSTRQWGLKALCDELLGIDIQSHGRKGHDCLEDTLAAREVTLWCTRELRQLHAWTKRVREEGRRKKKKQGEKKREGMARENGKGRVRARGEEEDDEDDEVLRWADIAEDCGWPHPDTGYDPWSD